MRVTYALFMDIALRQVVPKLYEAIEAYDWTGAIDRDACRVRMEFARVEIENIEAKDEVACRRIAEIAAKQLLVTVASRYGMNDVEQIRVEAVRVENAPNVIPDHNLGGANPAVLCPQCSKPMIVRRMRGGEKPAFYGCRDYPTCRGTRPISD